MKNANVMYNGIEIKCTKLWDNKFNIKILVPYFESQTEKSDVKVIEFESNKKLRNKDISFICD